MGKKAKKSRKTRDNEIIMAALVYLARRMGYDDPLHTTPLPQGIEMKDIRDVIRRRRAKAQSDTTPTGMLEYIPLDVPGKPIRPAVMEFMRKHGIL